MSGCGRGSGGVGAGAGADGIDIAGADNVCDVTCAL